MPGEIYILGWGSLSGVKGLILGWQVSAIRGGRGSLGALQASPHLPVPVFPGLACG